MTRLILCMLVACTLALSPPVAAQTADYKSHELNPDRFVALKGKGGDEFAGLVGQFLEVDICPLDVEFTCGCYLDGFLVPCSFVSNCLQAGFCEPVAPSHGIVLKEIARLGPFTITPRVNGSDIDLFCNGDDPAACDIIAQVCEDKGGVGQCGGPNNPNGCDCDLP